MEEREPANAFEDRLTPEDSRVEWEDDSVYLTGWAEILVDGDWLRA